MDEKPGSAKPSEAIIDVRPPAASGKNASGISAGDAGAPGDEDNSAARSNGGTGSGADKMRAWDLPTRLFHWLLVLMIIAAPLTRKFGDIELFWHKLNGYGVLTLLLFRLIWGVVGGSTSRLWTFVSWPWTALGYGLDLLRGRARRYLGHNPLGGWMVVALLAALGFQTGTGLFANDDALAEGPLVSLVSYDMSGYLTGLHYWGFRIILGLAALHIAASFIYLFWKKENLISPMINGYKERADHRAHEEARFGSPLRALVCLGIAAGLVFAGIRLAGGTFF